MAKFNPIFAVVLFLLVVTFVITIVSVATPVWTVNENATHGLFRHCHLGTCMTTPHVHPYKKATSAFSIMGIICQGVAIICFLVCLFKNRKMLRVGACSCTVVAMVFTMIASAVFTGMHILLGSTNWFGYSFWLGWVGFIFNTLAAIVAIVGAAHKIED